MLLGAVVGSALLVGACTKDDVEGGASSGSTEAGANDGGTSEDGGSGSAGDGSSAGEGQTTYSCEQTGKFCVEYTGSPTNIDTIRGSSKCVEQGGVEGTGCARDGVTGICMLPANGSTGTSGAQYYYVVDEDLLMSVKSACERGGGTFSSP